MRLLPLAAAFLAASVLNIVAAQQPAAPGAPTDDGQAKAQDEIVGSMSGHHMHGATPHMRLTPQWSERPGDRQRAEAIVTALRGALDRYRDYHVA
jgi:hypothetical protein